MAELARRAPTGAIIQDKGTLKALLEADATKSMIRNVASKYMTEDRISKAALLALSRQPKLANCTTTSFLQSMMKAAQLDLDFSGATGQAYLVPYGKACVLVVGYQGMVEVAYRSDKVAYIDAQLVYENDECKFNLGTNPTIVHQPYYGGDRGEVKFAYAVARLKGIEIPKIELMSKDEILKIKNRSKAKDDGPWQTDEPEMMRKTVIRRIFKYLPKTQEILTAAEIDNMSYDYGNAVAEDVKTGVAGLKERIKDATPPKHVDSEQKDISPLEPAEVEQLQQADEKPKKKGRPKGSKNRPKETAPEPTPEPTKDEDMMPIDDVQKSPIPENVIPETPPEEPTPAEEKQEPPADKLLDKEKEVEYECGNCGWKSNQTGFGANGLKLCEKCFSADIKES
jgi:recombination protein RecT